MSDVDKAMQEFIEKNADYDIDSKLKDVNHMIEYELYNIKRVVDDGNFHKVLENGV